jgi:hypothetical protein
MGMFSRHIEAVVVALSWKRTVVIEQGRWESRRTAWKPYGGTVRNLRTAQDTALDIVFNNNSTGEGAYGAESRPVVAKHTYYEYEEFEWHRYRSFSAKGDGPAGVRLPECAPGPDQRIGERRESYRAKFSADAEYVTELDEATWRTLEVGLRCRLTVSAFSGDVKQVTPVPG